MKRAVLALVGLLVASAVAACSPTTKAAVVAEACRATESKSAAHAVTRSYEMQVEMVLSEPMYTQEEVAKQHPTSGEVMLAGEMGEPMVNGVPAGDGAPMMSPSPGSGMSGSSMSSPSGTSARRHLEVHICSRADGHVVADAHPTITMTDTRTRAAQTVPFAAMRGVDEGPEDIHYGNVVEVVAGDPYSIGVTQGREAATVTVTAI